tara:strand:+ start:216 stop:569 length:354 start_codon:yes stop_codon:yes gene_type:complete
MPFVTLTFQYPINVSCEIGDSIYFCNTTSLGVHTHVQDNNDINYLGTVSSITSTVIVVDTGTISVVPAVDDFIMFSKDNAANLTSILGYFAEVKFVNNSNIKSELFSIGSEIFESSK